MNVMKPGIFHSISYSHLQIILPLDDICLQTKLLTSLLIN